MSAIQIIIALITVIIALAGLYITYRKFNIDNGTNSSEWFVIDKCRITIPGQKYSSYFASMIFINRKPSIPTNVIIPLSQNPLFVDFDPELDSSIIESNGKYKLKFSVPPNNRTKVTVFTEELLLLIQPISDNSDLKSSSLYKLSNREGAKNEARKFWIGVALGLINGLAFGFWLRLFGLI